VIPKSFELTLPNGERVWVAGNATEHIAEFAQMKAVNYTPEAVRLASQEQLSSLQGAVNTATQNGVPYNQLINVGGWELKFAPPRQPGQLPALIPAVPGQ
jgi:filamentous hemagglutinin